MARIPLWKIKKAQRQSRQHKITIERWRMLHSTLFRLYLEGKIDIFELCNLMKNKRRIKRGMTCIPLLKQ